MFNICGKKHKIEDIEAEGKISMDQTTIYWINGKKESKVL